MIINTTELCALLENINGRYGYMINLQYVEREGKQYVIETNEMFSPCDDIMVSIEAKINEFLAPSHYLETEIANVYMISK